VTAFLLLRLCLFGVAHDLDRVDGHATGRRVLPDAVLPGPVLRGLPVLVGVVLRAVDRHGHAAGAGDDDLQGADGAHAAAGRAALGAAQQALEPFLGHAVAVLVVDGR